MKRRRLLALAGTGVPAALAGCPVGYVGDRRGESPAAASISLPVPESELRRSAPRDGIPAITGPALGPDWSGTSTGFGSGTTYRPRLANEELVAGVARADVAGERGR